MQQQTPSHDSLTPSTTDAGTVHECSACKRSFSWVFNGNFEERACPHCGQRYMVDCEESWDGEEETVRFVLLPKAAVNADLGLPSNLYRFECRCGCGLKLPISMTGFARHPQSFARRVAEKHLAEVCENARANPALVVKG